MIFKMSSQGQFYKLYVLFGPFALEASLKIERTQGGLFARKRRPFGRNHCAVIRIVSLKCISKTY